MEHEPWLPTNDVDTSDWLNNFSGQLAISGALFGFLPADVTYFEKAAVYFAFIVADLNQARKDVVAKTSARDTLEHGDPSIPTVFAAFTPAGIVPPTSPANLIPAIYAAVAQIKGKKGVYTPTWGDTYRITGAAHTFVPSAYEGNVKVEVFTDHCTCSFKKVGAQGAAIFCMVNNDPAFTKIAQVTKSPFTDTTPLRVPNTPERRKYYTMGTLDDKIIGHPSPIITVTFGGPLT